MKLNRDYILTVGVGPYGPPTTAGAGPIAKATKTVVIKPPYTIEFDVKREFAAVSQTATIKIENLGEGIRNAIYKDPFSAGLYAEVQLQAGYQGQYLPTIFRGTILWAQSHREGQKNFVTEISAQDGGFAMATSYTSAQLGPSQSLADALGVLNADLFGVSATPLLGTLPQGPLGLRTTLLVGPTFGLIQKILPIGFSATIDTNQLKVLADTDGIQFGSTVYVIDAATGLLDPPVREGVGISCKMLFEPRITVGQYVVLKSEDNSLFNGGFQVKGVSHAAIISPTKNGPATTTLQIYNFGKITQLTGSYFAPNQ